MDLCGSWSIFKAWLKGSQFWSAIVDGWRFLSTRISGAFSSSGYEVDIFVVTDAEDRKLLKRLALIGLNSCIILDNTSLSLEMSRWFETAPSLRRYQFTTSLPSVVLDLSFWPLCRWGLRTNSTDAWTTASQSFALRSFSGRRSFTQAPPCRCHAFHYDR